LVDFSDIDRAISESEWSKWLSLSDKKDEITILRRNVEKGLPC